VSTETMEQADLVWVVADEPEPRRPLTIKISITVPDRLAALKALPMPAVSEGLRAKFRESMSMSVMAAAVTGVAIQSSALGALRRSLSDAAEAEKCQALTGRPYPICGPHRATITDRYAGGIEFEAAISGTWDSAALIDIASTDVL
jgi:hypothetical protein